MSEARESCAVFGIFAPERDVSRITYYGLFALQHRGQESSGIAVANGEHITCLKDMGLVTQVFDEDRLQLLKGTAAIGHNRYSTTGGSLKRNAQPMVFNKHFSAGARWRWRTTATWSTPSSCASCWRRSSTSPDARPPATAS